MGLSGFRKLFFGGRICGGLIQGESIVMFYAPIFLRLLFYGGLSAGGLSEGGALSQIFTVFVHPKIDWNLRRQVFD